MHTTLAESPNYQALSYMWGDATHTKTIAVDDIHVEVRENLWSALWHIREHDRLNNTLSNRTLWIDALCVNQSDVGERNHQVRLMSQIYSRASEVVVWLGPEADHSDLAFKMLHSVADPSAMRKTTEREFTALIRLLNRKYFERMWIIQEISLAQDVTIHCGLLNAKFGDAQYFNNYSTTATEDEDPGEDWIEDHEQIRHPPDAALSIRARDQTSKSLAAKFFDSTYERLAPRGHSLARLLVAFQNSQCTDPRDKVFALLGLADDCEDTKIVADYSKPVDTVYQDVMLAFEFGDPVLFSQMLQQSLRAHRDLHRGSEEESLSKSALRSHSWQRRPWIKFSGWGGGVVSAFGPTFDKCHLTGKIKLSSVVKAEIEDIEPVNGLPKAIMRNDTRYDLAVIEARGILPLDPQFLDGSEVADESSCVRSFLLNTGQIGLGPMNIQEGDLVRRITRSTSMAVVLRKDASGLLTIVGRAVVLRVSVPRDRSWEWNELITGTGDDFFREGMCGFSIPKVTIFLDLLTLQRWTKWNGQVETFDFA